jgi:hypothetical protein
MQPGTPRNGINKVFWRMRGRWLLLSLIALFTPQILVALEARPMSASVVLVLKLVSATHVKPSTGIVITDDGLVLVPAEFASLEGEIIVLDGGADIVKHGRPGRLLKQMTSGKLAVILVKGLQRPGITLSESAPVLEQEFHLTAFPPAEYIAKGAPPLWAPVKFIESIGDAQFSISPTTPLPYVSGPILDACGYLTGINLASGPPSLKPGGPTLTIFADELRRSLESTRIISSIASCEPPSRAKTPPPELVQESTLNTPASISLERTPQRTDPELVGPEVYNPHIPRKRLNPFQGSATPPHQLQPPVRPSIWRVIPWWMIVLGMIIVAALTWKGYSFVRQHKNDLRKVIAAHSTTGAQAASGEPDTALLATASVAGGTHPRAAPGNESDLPDIDTLPDGCDAILMVEGTIDSDNRFKRYCFVDSRHVNVVIGRGDADINIQHPVISRHHVRLESNRDDTTISDLGSRSGTFLNGTPCLEGEVMYVEADDELVLGDLQVRFSFIRKEPALS